jgi:rsbT antagonist protein RsbS
MHTPILRQGPFLVVTLQSDLTDEALIGLRDALGERIGKWRSRGVLVDLSAIDVLDSFATRMLRTMAHMARLRGAETVVVGIQPDVALAMAQLGLTLDGIETALDFEEGLDYLAGRISVTADHAE